MSGGIAYVYDPTRTFGERVNPELVDVEELTGEDYFFVKSLIERHGIETDSAIAATLLDNWGSQMLEFVKVMPRDYRRILEATRLGANVMEAAHG